MVVDVSSGVNVCVGMRELKSAAVCAANLLESTPTRAANAGAASTNAAETATTARTAQVRNGQVFMEARISLANAKARQFPLRIQLAQE